MTRPASHSVITILSVRRNGPTLVSVVKVVPTPSCWSDWKWMAMASAIHST